MWKGKKKYIQLLTTINMIFSIAHYQCNIESIEELQNLFVFFSQNVKNNQKTKRFICNFAPESFN